MKEIEFQKELGEVISNIKQKAHDYYTSQQICIQMDVFTQDMADHNVREMLADLNQYAEDNM